MEGNNEEETILRAHGCGIDDRDGGSDDLFSGRQVNQECFRCSYREGDDRMKKKKQGQRGFTLLETLISLCILSVALLGMSSMVFSVIRATAQSKEMTTATTLLQDKMENLKNTSISSLTSGNDSASLGNITYLRQWVISTVGNLKTISVTVNWTGRGAHGVSATTLRG